MSMLRALNSRNPAGPESTRSSAFSEKAPKFRCTNPFPDPEGSNQNHIINYQNCPKEPGRAVNQSPRTNQGGPNALRHAAQELRCSTAASHNEHNPRNSLSGHGRQRGPACARFTSGRSTRGAWPSAATRPHRRPVRRREAMRTGELTLRNREPERLVGPATPQAS